MGKPFFTKLLEELTRDDVSLSECLRKARLAAESLKLGGVARWMDLELKGYTRTEDMPPYRMCQGVLQAYNPYHGWQAVMAHDGDLISKLSKALIGSAIATIEHDARSPEGHLLEFTLLPETRNMISRSLDHPANVRLLLPPNTPRDILEAVRNLLTDWCLQLEKSGITGNGVTFDESDKTAAPQATENFVVNNYGTIGNVVGDSTNSTVTSEMISEAAVSAIQELVQQIHQLREMLPASIRDDVTRINSDLAKEVGKPAPNRRRLAELAHSLRTICEGAAGNLTAQGILAVLGGILSG